MKPERVKIDLVAAARPNFMKIAPLYRSLCGEGWCSPRIVHTGQHYDERMSDFFFRDLGLPAPYVNLEIGSGTHAEQTGRVMVAYESFCFRDRPDWTVVAGDVNSTVACALAARKIGIHVAHLEAGLRSNDRSMPEELNRLATDAISDLLWTPSEDASANLEREGIPTERIDFVGNIMIDAYEYMKSSIADRKLASRLGLSTRKYGVVTLHRPSNVDEPVLFRKLILMLQEISREVDLVFPVHPRTRQKMSDLGIGPANLGARIQVIDPVGYVDFMSLVTDAQFALTDSGGVQEETTYLGIPCLTLRENTERPVTIAIGTNELVAPGDVLGAVKRVKAGSWKKGSVPTHWDGRTASRVVESLRSRVFR